jgi:hypothetical protein
MCVSTTIAGFNKRPLLHCIACSKCLSAMLDGCSNSLSSSPRCYNAYLS